MNSDLRLALLFRVVSYSNSFRNRLFNHIVSFVCNKKIRIDWSNVKIINPESIKIGNNFCAGRFLWLESVSGKGDLRIGSNINASDFVHIGCSNAVTIGNDVLIGSKVLITDHSHGEIAESLIPGREIQAPNLRPLVSKGPVVIERAVGIGDGSCVLSGVTIGEGSIIGANSVVVSDIPPRTVWGGIPAKQIWPKL